MSLLTVLRCPRIFGIALFDFASAFIVLALLLRWWIPERPISFYLAWTTVLILPISIVSHLLSKTPTTLNYYLGLSPKPLS